MPSGPLYKTPIRKSVSVVMGAIDMILVAVAGMRPMLIHILDMNEPMQMNPVLPMASLAPKVWHEYRRARPAFTRRPCNMHHKINR